MRYLDPAGRACEQPLGVGWSVRFEQVPPVRKFSSYKAQRSFSGSWWSATTGELVRFESWLERDQLMMLDFSPEIIGFASQPFWLTWFKAGKLRRHAPDFFARALDGTGVVIDVRADERVAPEDAEVFALTARACAQVGWAYRQVGVVQAVLAANVRWLAGHRHPRCRNDFFVPLLVDAFASGGPLLGTVEAIGDRLAVLPTLYHLLWSGELSADLDADVLSAGTTVTAMTSAMDRVC